MAESNQPDPAATPFAAFNFRVEIDVEGRLLCQAAFSKCSGLEVTMEPKTYREGGNNVTQFQLSGPVTYGQLTLKRGMTSSFDLWKWFRDATNPAYYGLRAKTGVLVQRTDRSGVVATFKLRNCLPVKLKAPSLNATEGGLAIEELQVAYEGLELKEAGQAEGTGAQTAGGEAPGASGADSPP